jgi:acetyl esterase
MDEQRSLANRVATRLLALPEPALEKLSGMAAEPVVRDGRVLNRRVQAMLAFGERTGQDREAGGSVEARRRDLKRLAPVGMPRRTKVRSVDRIIDGPEAPIPVRVYRRFGVSSPVPAIVYFHGGGWVTGDLDTHDGSCRLLADVTRCLVIAVDYRLAPENPFPAAVIDALAAYDWVHENAGELGVDRGSVGVMGDSAGANLAAVVAQQRRAGTSGDIPAPIAQCLVYPAVDAHLSQPSIDTFAEGFFLTREDMIWFRGHYLPDPASWDDLRASPLLAPDLAGLAPAAVFTAGFDPLRDDGRAYADALAAAGVPVRYRCYDDLIHGFFGMGVLPDGIAVATEICAAMGELVRATASRT